MVRCGEPVMGEFRDPRGDRERMENVLSDKIEVIASRRERITEETYGVSGDFTEFRDLSQIYVDGVRLWGGLGRRRFWSFLRVSMGIVWMVLSW